MCSKDRCLAEALNELRDANLHGVENDLLGFVQDYFVPASDDEGDASSSDSDSSSIDGFNENDDESDEEPIDPSILTVDILPLGLGDHVECNGEREMNGQRDKAREFLCKCQTNHGGPCSERFTPEEFVDFQSETAQLTRGEQDMLILGQICSAANNSELTMSARRGEQTERQRQRSTFMFHGQPVCTTTFLFLHNMSRKKLAALQKHYRENGCTPRTHGNSGRVVPRHLSYDDNTRVKHFISNYAETHAILLPGRIPGFKRDDIKLLPSCETKANVWRKYKQAMELSDARVVAQTTFRKIWNVVCPFVVCCKPMSDICWQCQKNNSLLYKSANLPDAEKQDRCKRQQEHLANVTSERSFYRELVKGSKETAEQQGVMHLGLNNPCSRPVEMHYSFDFAQQVHFPSDPMQPGPIYFLTPRKLGIFGVHCEGVTQQVNYLVDESVVISKGSNAVISFVHHFFSQYGLGESNVHLHCDNCSGQNKNRFMLWYLLWRCSCGLHRSIQLHFMVVGHTKFAPDWCFGLFKQRYRRTQVSCLDDVHKVVTASTPSGVNIPQLVGDEDGNVIVPQYAWNEFLTPFFKPLVGIKSFQHFRFTSDEPGVVYAKKCLGDPEISFQLLKSHARPRPDLPEPQNPPGLDAARQWYLYEKIREFCSVVAQDTTCPLPNIPKP